MKITLDIHHIYDSIKLIRNNHTDIDHIYSTYNLNSWDQNETKAFEEEDILFSNLVHELKAPMRGMMGLVQLALISNTQQHTKTMDNGYQSSEALLEVINDIFDYSLEDRLIINNVKFDINEVIDDVVTLFSASAEIRGIELIVPACTDAQFIIGDPYKLRGVLANIVGNLLKFTVGGCISIEYETKKPKRTDVGLIFTIEHRSEDQNNVENSYFKPIKENGQGLILF